MNKSIMAALATVSVVLGLLISAWAVDQRFISREVHLLCMQGIADQFKSIQRSQSINDAYRDVQFWTQQEASLRIQLARVPTGTELYGELIRQLTEATRQRNEAQRKLNELRSK